MNDISKKIPVNVVMGELGSGKTTVIMELVKQIANPNYQVVWLKNEYGDVNVDTKLAEEAGIKTEEIMNGCLCCTAVGNLEGAIEQILTFKPNRIIIETAGTAHPAPIVMELKRFSNIIIDSLVEVVDAVNFSGFNDPSVIRQSYTQYVDFCVINKAGLVDEKRMDEVLDAIYEVYNDTPIIKTTNGFVLAETIIGLAGDSVTNNMALENGLEQAHNSEAHEKMEWFSVKSDDKIFSADELTKLIKGINKRDIWRVKGIIKTENGWQVMNSVFCRVTWQLFESDVDKTEILFIGPDAKMHQSAITQAILNT